MSPPPASSSAFHWPAAKTAGGAARAGRVPARGTLDPASALTLRADASGKLRITHGLAWLTYDLAWLDRSALAGDHFLQAGDEVLLCRGQGVVIESRAAGATLHFSWQPTGLPAGGGIGCRIWLHVLGLLQVCRPILTRTAKSG